MTPDELASPPRKAKWKRWAIALACVVAAATIALLASAPKPEPVKVWFVRATNEAGVKKLVFEGTNGLPCRVACFAGMFPAASGGSAGVPPSASYHEIWTTAAPRTRFSFSLATSDTIGNSDTYHYI